MVDTAPTTRRRWFRFSLSTMLIAVTLGVGAIFGLSEYYQAQRGREQVQIGRVSIGEIDTVDGELTAAGIRWSSQGIGQSASIAVQKKDAERAI
jgi:hypothetical protein